MSAVDGGAFILIKTDFIKIKSLIISQISFVGEMLQRIPWNEYCNI
jgi:hypothetical protein